MEVLTLEEAERLRKVIYSDEDATVESLAQYLVVIRKLYYHGFAVGAPENILWSNFREMMDDLGVTD